MHVRIVVVVAYGVYYENPHHMWTSKTLRLLRSGDVRDACAS